MDQVGVGEEDGETALPRWRLLRKFVELWKKVDPMLQPAVKEVRERLAKLATEE